MQIEHDALGIFPFGCEPFSFDAADRCGLAVDFGFHAFGFLLSGHFLQTLLFVEGQFVHRSSSEFEQARGDLEFEIPAGKQGAIAEA
jgi:hypothetical protein